MLTGSLVVIRTGRRKKDSLIIQIFLPSMSTKENHWTSTSYSLMKRRTYLFYNGMSLENSESMQLGGILQETMTKLFFNGLALILRLFKRFLLTLLRFLANHTEFQ